MPDLKDLDITELAELQLKLAIISGEPWAIKQQLEMSSGVIKDTLRLDLSKFSDSELIIIRRLLGNSNADDSEFDILKEIEKSQC